MSRSEVETAFMQSRADSTEDNSLQLRIQHERSSSTNRNTRDTEDAPLLSLRLRNPRESKCAPTRLGALILLVLACILTGLVTFIGVILLTVGPETLKKGKLQIHTNDTILAVPDSGLDPNTVNYITYQYSYDGQESMKDIAMSQLFLYQEQCKNLPSLTKSYPLSVSYSITFPEHINITQVVLDNRYLLKESTIEYRINLTLSTSETVPPYCYAMLHLSSEEGSLKEEICDTTATYQLTTTKNSYTPLYLSVTDKNVHLQAIDVYASGTVHYYDVMESSHDGFACQINPPFTIKCKIQIWDQNNNNKVCFLALLESHDQTDEVTAHLDYSVSTFSYKQVIPLVLVCVGLIAFVCLLGLLFSCCTRQSRRMRQALHMTSPLRR